MSYLSDWKFNVGAGHAVAEEVQQQLGARLPADYLEFMHAHDGGEGFVGSRYLVLWSLEELPVFNAEYEVALDAPGLLLFGSSGGGEGYGFDMRDDRWTVVRVPFIGMSLEYARPVGLTFTRFLEELGRP